MRLWNRALVLALMLVLVWPSAAAKADSSRITVLRRVAATHRWSGAQVTYWAWVIHREDRTWSLTITNGSCYGIAQFIGGPSEYASYGGSTDSLRGELVGMGNYIAGRYGTPEQAWGHEEADGWY